MRMHLKQYTEPISNRLADYRARLAKHPLIEAARTGELPTEILHELAFHQYSDSIRLGGTSHVRVDTAEHAAGMADAFAETLEVPDALWRRRCASH